MHSDFKFRALCRMGAYLSLALALASCGTPDQRTYENGWNVIRNQCGDVSSTVQGKKQFEMSITRKVTFHDQQKHNIYSLSLHVTQTGSTWHRTTYANDSANTKLETKKIKESQIDKDLAVAVDTYYNQPGKHQEFDFDCLYKGIYTSL